VPVVIGTLPTEDMLPLWVAEEEGLFAEYGLDSVEIVTFQAAQERDAAFVAGEIDAFMGDIIAAAQLEAAGTPVTIATVMLGATPAEGRFGIVAAPDSGYADIAALAGVPVGTSQNTIQEYVLDGLMRQAGVSADDVVVEAVPKVPVRYDLLMQGQLKAAALPEPLLSLAEFEGATLLADDTTGENLSQTVLVFSDEYLSEIGGVDTMSALLKVWDAGVEIVNADPDAWRDLLVEQARLPEPIKDTYRINQYPTAQIPTTEQVDAVLDWMRDKGTLQSALTYEDLVLVTP
jgi:NitT/TauT family transport system substrate-binding protein